MTEKEARRLEVPTVWNGKANVCTYCGRVPEIFYIVTGHDHTDDSVCWCPCRDVSEIEQLRKRVNELEAENARLKESNASWREVATENLQGMASCRHTLAAHEAVIKQMREALDTVSRCSIDPALVEMAKHKLTLKPTTEHLDAYVKGLFGEPVAWASKLPEAHGYSMWQQKPLSDWWVRHEKLLIPLYALKEQT